MKSIWEADGEIAKQRMLPCDMAVETVVIGAGMAGILTAYFLEKQGHNVVLVEAKRIGSGQTRGTTAKITSQHGLCYHKMIRKIGRKKAAMYASANQEAIAGYQQIIKEEEIDCDFELKKAYLYTVQENKRAELQWEVAAAQKLGIPAFFLEGKEVTDLPFPVKGAVCFPKQAQFHPLKFIRHLSKELKIYEDTKVLKVKGHKVFTNRGTIYAGNIVFATHYPFVNVPGFYFLRQHQERSYVLALKVQEKLEGMYYGVDDNGLSLRSAGELLLLGGGGHRTGKRRGQCYGYLKKMARIYYPKSEEVAVWSAQDCMPHDEMPFIGRYSRFKSYWYVATGFQKWGMTSSMIAAKAISGQIMNNRKKPEGCLAVFSPQRFLVRASCKNLLVDIAESVKGLGKGLIVSRKKRCPHMGCALEWNPEENSWDCPCHGSRFGEKGELKDNPAQRDLLF